MHVMWSGCEGVGEWSLQNLEDYNSGARTTEGIKNVVVLYI